MPLWEEVTRVVGRHDTFTDERRFVRIHRSAIVNIDLVHELRQDVHGDYVAVFSVNLTSFAMGRPLGSCFTNAARYSSTRVVRHARSHSDPLAEAEGAWAFATRAPIAIRSTATVAAFIRTLLRILVPFLAKTGQTISRKPGRLKCTGSFRASIVTHRDACATSSLTLSETYCYGASRTMKKSRRYLLLLLALLALGYFFYRFRNAITLEGFRWGMVAQSLRYARVSLLLLGIATIYVCFALRALRWMRFCRWLGPTRFSNVYSATLMGFACVFLLGRAGEPIRPVLIARKDSLSMPGMLGVYVLERISDAAA